MPAKLLTGASPHEKAQLGAVSQSSTIPSLSASISSVSQVRKARSEEEAFFVHAHARKGRRTKAQLESVSAAWPRQPRSGGPGLQPPPAMTPD